VDDGDAERQHRDPDITREERQTLAVEVVAQVPPQREAVGHDAHELPLGAQILEEHNELQLRASVNRIHGQWDGRLS
jgi:hypothetical protein